MSDRSISIPLPPNGALVWPWVARSLCAAERRGVDPVSWAESMRAPAAAIRILKAGPVGASTLAGDALSDVRAATKAFLESLATKSVLARIVNDGAIVRVPLNRRVGVITQDATGWIVGEGAPVPLSKLELNSTTITAVKAAAMNVFTDEFFNDAGPELEQTFVRSLRDAVAKVVDTYFLGQLLADSDAVSNASSGDDLDDFLLDLRTALLALQPTSDRLYWVGGRTTAVRLSVLPFNSFPETSPTGGTTIPINAPTGGTLRGLPFLMSSAVDDDGLLLLDAGALAGNLGDVTMRAGQPTLEMLNNPTNSSASPTGTSMVSTWQTNSVALMTTVSFGVEQLRPSVASISGISWGGGPST